MREAAPAVTIGIPTFNRPDCLARALECVSRQGYPNLRVVVSDNATPGDEVQAVVERFRGRIAHLELVKHPQNIGPRPNFFFLLERCDTPYFMWLADDDEVSDNYVERLVELLEADPGTVTASGNWYWMRSPHGGELMKPRQFASPSAAARAAAYLWKADDAFFYGLHRTDVLRQASFTRYAWPNQDSVMNWAYVYLLDMVLRGKVLIHPDKSVRFINHDYTTKSYVAHEPRLAGWLKHVLRRLNVHALYIGKIARARGFLFALPFCFVSLASLSREALSRLRARLRGARQALLSKRFA